MRLSARKDDPGYEAFNALYSNGKRPVAFLDGVEQRAAVTADEEAGLIVRHVLDDEGKPQLDPNDPHRVWEETVRGEVRIEVR